MDPRRSSRAFDFGTTRRHRESVGAIDAMSARPALPAIRARKRRPAAVLEPYEQWARLAERVGASPFAHPGWIGTWAAVFGGGRRSVEAVERDGRLVAIAPFRPQATGVISRTNWHTPQCELL